MTLQTPRSAAIFATPAPEDVRSWGELQLAGKDWVAAQTPIGRKAEQEFTVCA